MNHLNKFLIFLIFFSFSLTGCLPGETPATPGTPTSSGGGGSGSGTGGDTGTTVTYPTDPALGGPYSYWTVSTDGRLGFWTVYTPTTAAGVEDTTQNTLVHGVIISYQKGRVQKQITSIVKVAANCPAGNLDSLGRRSCSVENNNTIAGANLATSCTTTLGATWNGFTIDYAGRSDVCTETINLPSAGKVLSQGSSFAINDQFTIAEVPGILLQVNFKTPTKIYQANMQSLTHYGNIGFYGFAGTDSDCTDSNIPDGYYQSFQIKSGLGNPYLPNEPSTQLGINIKNHLIAGGQYTALLCGDNFSSSFNGCTIGGQFRNLDKTSMGLYFNGNLDPITPGSCVKGLRTNNLSGFAFFNSWGGILYFNPEFEAPFLGVRTSSTPIVAIDLINKSLVGLSIFNTADSQGSFLDSGNVYRASFLQSTTNSLGYYTSISSTNSGTIGAPRTPSSVTIEPLFSNLSRDYYSNFQFLDSSNGNIDSATAPYVGDVTKLASTVGMYQLYEDFLAPSIKPSRQALGIIGRIGRHLLGIFSYHDTIGGIKNFLNLTGVQSLDNPIVANGFVPLKMDQVLWDTKAIVHYNSKNQITVSPWLYEAATDGDFIRVVHGQSSALIKGTYKITKNGLSTFNVVDILTGASTDILDGTATGSSFDDSNIVLELLTTTDSTATSPAAATTGLSTKFRFPKFVCSVMGPFGRTDFGRGDSVYAAFIQPNGITSKHLVTGITADCEVTTSTAVPLVQISAGNYITHGISIAFTNNGAVGANNWKLGTDTSGISMIDLSNQGVEGAAKYPGSIVEVFVEHAGVSTSHIYMIDRKTLEGGDKLYLSRNGVISVPTSDVNDKIHYQYLSRPQNYDVECFDSAYSCGLQTTGFLMMYER